MAQSTVPEGLFLPLTSSSSTRVFVLDAGKYFDPVTGTLTEFCLDHTIEPGSTDYEAVSYVWGPRSSITAEITNVTINSFTYEVRNNLHQGLRRLRRPDRPRRLWIDAIYISQTDLQEKARQVAQLSEVFRFAKKVLVWTGEHYDNSELLFQKTTGHYQDLDGQLARKGSRLSQVLKDNCGARRLLNQWAASYVAFTQRPYWKRLWPIQEIGVATNLQVHCGESHQSWDALVQILWDDAIEDCSLIQDLWEQGHSLQDREELVLRNHFVILTSFHEIAHRDTNYQDFTWDTDIDHFLDLFVQYNYNDCEDRHDRVYALLSLFKAASLPTDQVPPDYTIKVPELFVRVCESMLNATCATNDTARQPSSARLDELAAAMRLQRDEHSEAIESMLARTNCTRGHLRATWAHFIYCFYRFVILSDDDLNSRELSELERRLREEQVVASLRRIRLDPAMQPHVDCFPEEQNPWESLSYAYEEVFEQAERTRGSGEDDISTTAQPGQMWCDIRPAADLRLHPPDCPDFRVD